MRTFTNAQRKALLLSSDYCKGCGQPLDRMHADHIIPYSKNGPTVLSNAQALCPKCNLLKSVNVMERELKLRPWQEKATKRLIEVYNEGGRDFLCVACVGAGKTIYAAYTFDLFKKKNIYDSVVVISPTENIKRNWSKNIELAFGIKVDHSYTFKHAWPRDCHGISITFQSLNQPNVELLSKYITNRTLLIVDEVHHAGDMRSWGEAIKQIGELAGFRLLLSGTPDRADNAPIPFVDYREFNEETQTWKLESNYSYNYAQAVDDEKVCPVIFQRNKADVETFGGSKVLDYEQEDKDEQRRLYNQVIAIPKKIDEKKPSWAFQTFEKANEKLNELNDLRNENYAGLIVCNTIEDAENLYEHIYEKYGPDFVEIVTSNQRAGDLNASKKIERFTTSRQSWIISINMISEGVDIPRLRVIVYASNVTTKVRFIQVMGRAVRNPEHLPDNSDVAYFFLADYKPLIENAERIKRELAHIYSKIEEEEERRKKRERSLPQFSLEDLLLEADAIAAGNVFDGDLWDIEEDVKATAWAKKEKVTKDKVLKLWKYFREEMEQKPSSLEEKPFTFRTSTEQKEDLRKKISKLVNKIAYELDGRKPSPDTIKKVHWELNQKCGIQLSNTATLDQLKAKFSAAEKWYVNLRTS